MPAPGRPDALWLTAIVIAGVGVRAYRLRWGLPQFDYPDGVMYFVHPGARLVALGEWVPAHFVHPPLLVYVTGLVYAAWSLVSGTAIAAAGPAFQAQLPTLALIGRVISVVFSAAVIVALAELGRRLIGSRGALLAAAVFALAPLQVLEAHRIQPDAPMLLLMLLATRLAVAAHDRRRRALLLAAYFLAGLSGGFKYTGPAAAAVPAWLTLRWADAERWSRRVAWLALGGAVTLLGLALGCLAVFFDWARAWQTASSVIYYSYLVGQSGLDIQAHGWTYVRYVYALVVGLPYMMGWPAYLASIAGLAVLVRHRPWAAGVVLSFVVPYLAIMGGAQVVVARYYLPLAPFLALAAGAALDRCLDGPPARRRLGVVVTAAVLGYTMAVSVSQCRRLGLGPQQLVAAAVAERAGARDVPDGRAGIAYPHPLTLYYDALKPLLAAVRVDVSGACRAPTCVVFYPPEHQNPRTEEPDAPAEGPAIAAERRWIRDEDVVVVILPSWEEHAFLRARPHGGTARFYRHLADGTLGFRLAGDFRTRFLTQALYTWGDPMLDTHWETGITGYKVFVRVDGAGDGQASGNR